MMNVLAAYFCCLCTLLLVLESSAACQRRVCYHLSPHVVFPEPGIPNRSPLDINPFLCTHLIYAFRQAHQSYKQFNSLKYRNPRLKTLISMNSHFSPTVATARSRQRFVEDAVTFLRKNYFDGIDFFWKYPGSGISPASDKHKFTLLLQELRAAFEEESASTGRPRLLVSVAVPADNHTIQAGFEVPEITRVVDMLNVMTFDMHNVWPGHTAHPSPLFSATTRPDSSTQYNVDSQLKHYVSLGATKDKINVGIATHGRSFTLQGRKNPGGLGAKAGRGVLHGHTMKWGFLSHYEVCEMIARGATVKRIEEQKVPYLVLGNQWVGYEDTESIRDKVDYINREGYGGFVVWTLEYDDYKGTFCGQGRPYPLINAAKSLCDNYKSVSGPGK